MYAFKSIFLDILGFNKVCLSPSAIDQGKVPLLKASSLKNQGYPPKISSAHSPVRVTVASGLTFLQKRRYIRMPDWKI